jgi:hypothetical protein
VFVEGAALKWGQVECYGVGFILVLAQQLVSGKMVFGQPDELWGRSGGVRREDLGMDMVADLLHSYFVESGEAGFWWMLATIKQVGDNILSRVSEVSGFSAGAE